jgi:dTDP-glucose 4,6-dehydratase
VSARSDESVVLVTGASGLLGRELLEQFVRAGIHARGVDVNPPPAPLPAGVELLVGDLLAPATCAQACRRAAVVVHSAARQYHSAPPRLGRRRFFHANVQITRNIVEAALAAGAGHLVMVSSDMVYGLPPGRPIREDDPPRPIGPYGRSKLASEHLCLRARDEGVTVTILRPRLIIGPGRVGVLRRLFDRVRLGRPIPLIGSGENRYQMISVADVARACVLAIGKRQDGTFNLGSEDPPTVRALLAELITAAGSGSRLWPLPARPATAALFALDAIGLAPLAPEQFRIAGVDYVLDARQAREKLGWTPRDHDAEMLVAAYRAYVGAC